MADSAIEQHAGLPPNHELLVIASEARRATALVTRLVSFAQAQSGARLKISSWTQAGTNLEPTGKPNLGISDHRRRSTRILRSVLLNISGQNRVGNPVSELASAVAVNLHGCLYSSRYDYRLGSWVTMEAANQQIEGKLQSVRAQVKYIGLPRSPRDLYRVGVELEIPANIWGIKSPPKDWHPVTVSVGAATPAIAPAPDSQPPVPTQDTHAPSTVEAGVRPISSGTIELTAESSTALSEPGGPVRVLVSSDEILHALERKLQQEAEKAVALAVARRLDIAVSAAVKTIENATQMSLHNLEERGGSRVGILGRLKASLANLSERLRT